METKRCCRCRRELPVSEFSLSRKQKDGLQNYCKECKSRIERERYLFMVTADGPLLRRFKEKRREYYLKKKKIENQ